MRHFFRLCCKESHWAEENEFRDEKIVGICRGELCRERAPGKCLGFPLSMLETISRLQHREGKIQTEPGSLPEVTRMNLELGRQRGLELTGQSSRKELCIGTPYVFGPKQICTCVGWTLNVLGKNNFQGGITSSYQGAVRWAILKVHTRPGIIQVLSSKGADHVEYVASHQRL